MFRATCSLRHARQRALVSGNPRMGLRRAGRVILRNLGGWFGMDAAARLRFGWNERGGHRKSGSGPGTRAERSIQPACGTGAGTLSLAVGGEADFPLN